MIENVLLFFKPPTRYLVATYETAMRIFIYKENKIL
jgi:hypothetical protein